MPDDDSPEIYGLPQGIDKAIMKLKSKYALENLKILSTGIV